MCDESVGEWMCTNDCNGGVCYLSGCMDPNACNYNIDAEVSDDSCSYEIDCAGVCGGEAVEDVCGICAGNTTSEEECMGYYCNLELASYLGFGQGLSDITGFYQDGREFAVVGLILSLKFNLGALTITAFLLTPPIFSAIWLAVLPLPH